MHDEVFAKILHSVSWSATGLNPSYVHDGRQRAGVKRYRTKGGIRNINEQSDEERQQEERRAVTTNASLSKYIFAQILTN
jgi:hypothetical protein